VMVVQSVRIAICRGNSTPGPSSGGSQNNQSNSNAIILTQKVGVHNILSLVKRDRTAQKHARSVGFVGMYECWL